MDGEEFSLISDAGAQLAPVRHAYPDPLMRLPRSAPCARHCADAQAASARSCAACPRAAAARPSSERHEPRAHRHAGPAPRQNPRLRHAMGRDEENRGVRRDELAGIFTKLLRPAAASKRAALAPAPGTIQCGLPSGSGAVQLSKAALKSKIAAFKPNGGSVTQPPCEACCIGKIYSAPRRPPHTGE